MHLNDFYFLCVCGGYLLCSWAVLSLIYRSYVVQRFSFHLIFSGIYFVTFFLGFPFSAGLKYGFAVSLQRPEILFFTLVTATVGYFIYFLSYQFLSDRRQQAVSSEPFFAKKQANLTACLLLMIALVSVGYFIYLNGFLLFRLEKYSQIFSPLVNAVALKRFFYFFLPALLIFYFLNKSRTAWWLFLLVGIGFGTLTYFAVGGTRANVALAFALFLLIGWYQRYLSLIWLFTAGSLAIVVMFFLALARYNLNLQGEQAVFTFLYLTRDTFSPWENLATIFASDIEFQGLMPIVRDFYVYIPTSLWAERPDIVWNTANYFTKEVLGNQSGLAISPTLLGSFYLMGGLPLIAVGMALIGGLLHLTDRLFEYGKQQGNAIIQTYCLANLFNLIVLVREGADAFFSRWCFFSFVFGACWGVAYLLSYQENRNG